MKKKPRNTNTALNPQKKCYQRQIFMFLIKLDVMRQSFPYQN